jgi:hypothetical protein
MMLRRSLSSLLLAGALLAADATGPKLEASLRALYDAWKEKGDAGMQTEAGARGVILHAGNLVSIRIAAASERSVPQVRKAAVKYGGRIVATEGVSLYAEVPVPGLSKLASRPQVAAIYLDRPDQQPQIRK